MKVLTTRMLAMLNKAAQREHRHTGGRMGATCTEFVILRLSVVSRRTVTLLQVCPALEEFDVKLMNL